MLVKNLKMRHYLVLNHQIIQHFAWLLIMHLVIQEWHLLVLFISKMYLEKIIKCLKVTYIYCLVQLHGMFILNWHSRRPSEGSKDRYLINKRLKVGDGEFRDRNIFTEYFNEINSACGNIDQYNPKWKVLIALGIIIA